MHYDKAAWTFNCFFYFLNTCFFVTYEIIFVYIIHVVFDTCLRWNNFLVFLFYPSWTNQILLTFLIRSQSKCIILCSKPYQTSHLRISLLTLIKTFLYKFTRFINIGFQTYYRSIGCSFHFINTCYAVFRLYLMLLYNFRLLILLYYFCHRLTCSPFRLIFFIQIYFWWWVLTTFPRRFLYWMQIIQFNWFRSLTYSFLRQFSVQKHLFIRWVVF